MGLHSRFGSVALSGNSELYTPNADGSGGSDFITVVTLVGVTLGAGDTGNYIL